MKRLFPILGFATIVICVQVAMTAAGKQYCLTQATMAVYYSIVAVGLALVIGYAGQVSLGHAAFFAIGAYTTAVLTTHNLQKFQNALWAGWLKRVGIMVTGTDLYGAPILNVSPWAAFVAALGGTFVIACLIGYPALRLKGHYLAMATLGFGIIVYKTVLGTSLTGAADGITGVPPWHLPGGLVISGKSSLRVQNYYIACTLALLVIAMLTNLTRSRVGRALLAIHDREMAANAMGINTARYRLKAFVVSAMLAAAAGALLTHYTGAVGPSEAGPMKSVRYLALVAAGGTTNLWGVLLLSMMLNYLSLRGWFGSYDNAVFGIILIVIVSLAPEGPLQPIGNWMRRLIRKEQAGTTRA